MRNYLDEDVRKRYKDLNSKISKKRKEKLLKKEKLENEGKRK